MYTNANSSLNKRNEVFNTCRHRNQGLLSKLKWWEHLDFSFWYRKSNFMIRHVNKFVIPEDCNTSVIWNKLVELRVYSNKVICKFCVLVASFIEEKNGRAQTWLVFNKISTSFYYVWVGCLFKEICFKSWYDPHIICSKITIAPYLTTNIVTWRPESNVPLV